MYNSPSVAERIKLRAKDKGITVKETLEKSGLGFNTMSNMKTSMPKGDTLGKIADVLDCSVDYLLCRTENPQSHLSGNSVSVGKVSGNSGIVGNVVGSTIHRTYLENPQEIALIDLFRKFGAVEQSRIVTRLDDELKNREDKNNG